MKQGSGRWWFWAPLVVLLVLVPQFTTAKSTLNLFFLLFLFVTLAQSWNILAGFAGQVNLGHAAFFGLGALVTRALLGHDVPLWLSLPAGGLAATLGSMLVGVPAFRMKGAYFAIGTLAFAEVTRILVHNNLPGLSSLPPEAMAAYSLVPRYYLGLLVAVAIHLFLFWLTRSTAGLGIVAMREDESAAQAVGVAALRHKLLALAFSAGFAGLAGGLFAYYHVSYYEFHAFSPIWTFESLIIVSIGGAGTILGPVLGTAFYVLTREFLAVRLTDGHLYVFGVLFILVVLIWPGGLLEATSRLKRAILGGKGRLNV